MIENIEPYEIRDKYLGEKYGTIFKELIYAPDRVYATLAVKLRKEKVIAPLEKHEEKDPKDKKKTVKEVAPIFDILEEIEIEEKVRLKFEIYKDDVLLYSNDNYNSQIINFVFEPTPFIPEVKGKKGEIITPGVYPNPYMIFCKLDYSECPNWLKNATECEKEKVGWSIKVFSSDTLGFLKNSIKEESEQALKDEWEVIEKGRAEKAKKARLLFLVQEKRNLGENLNEEEEQVIKQPLRERKRSMPDLTDILPKILDKDKKKKHDNNKKQDKKKELEKEPEINPEYNLDLNKVNLPKVEWHTAKNVKNFLSYCYAERQLLKQKKSDKSKYYLLNYIILSIPKYIFLI